MEKQLELGTKYPMRPRTATLNTAADTDVDNDVTTDWTDTGNRLTLALDEEFFDDASGQFLGPQIAISSGNLRLGAGVWEIKMEVVVTNGEADDQTFECAITNSAGSTVRVESGEIIVPAGCSVAVSLTSLTELTVLADTSFRAVQSSAGGDGELTLNDERVGYVRKIGNAEENNGS